MVYYEIQNLYVENIESEVLKNLCMTFPEYYYIIHNYDININGTRKKEHYHCCIGVSSKDDKDEVLKAFKPYTERVINVRNIRKFLRYLIHLDNPDKYQYLKDNIVTNNYDYLVDKLESVSIVSPTDILLNNFISWLEDCFSKELIIDRYMMYLWFKEKGKISYFLNNENRLISLKLMLYDKYFGINRG